MSTVSIGEYSQWCAVESFYERGGLFSLCMTMFMQLSR